MSIITSVLEGCGVDAGKCVSFERFAQMLREANAQFNLTRITDDEGMARAHFADSLAPSLLGLLAENASVIDVGTGAGFPSIPLAIARPDLKITAVEASEKKTGFVRKVSDELGLDITCICGRAEELSRTELRESFDICVSRAVAPLGILLELCAPFVRVGGSVLAYKGENAQSELDSARRAVRALHLGGVRVIPSGTEGFAHSIIAFEKLSACPGEYPRRFSRIKAAPLTDD